MSVREQRRIYRPQIAPFRVRNQNPPVFRSMNININIISAQYICIRSVEMWKRDVRSFDVCANFCASHKWPLGSYNFNNTVPFCSVLFSSVQFFARLCESTTILIKLKIKNKPALRQCVGCLIDSESSLLTISSLHDFKRTYKKFWKIDRNEFQRNLLLLLWLSALDRVELLSQHLMHRLSFHHIECTFINYLL